MPTALPVSSRNDSIDTLRAIACIALVSYHVVGNSSKAGMEVPPEHWLALLNNTFVDMRMPLFSFLSGCVFLSLERLTRSPGQLLQSKMRRLLMPMLSVGLLFWLARTAMGQAEPALFNLLIMPYAHFWFLQATFVIMICFLFLYAVLPIRSTVLAAGLMVLGGLAWVAGPRPSLNLFSVIQAAYLMPFFMLGYLCAHSTLLSRLRTALPRGGVVLALLALAGTGYALAVGRIDVASALDRRAVTLIIGAAFCLSLLVLSPRHAGLARLGGYSYTIYLFHVFFTAGSFETLSALAPRTPDALIWGAGLFAGLLGPVMVHHVVMRSALLSTVLLGLRGAPRRIPPLAVAQSGLAQRA